jgi:propionyl-CoA synthetase
VAAGRGDAAAVIYDSPVTGTVETFTYARLQAEVGRLAAALVRLGVGKGDRVIIYMPMIPQTLFAMLACARLGAIHSVVFGGFAPHELAKRIDDATPRLLLTASAGIEGARKIAYKPMVDEALKLPPTSPNAWCCSSARRCRAIFRRRAIWIGPRWWKRPRLTRAARRRNGRRRSALYPLHQRHHRHAQGRGARKWRARRGAGVEHGQCLRDRAGRVFWAASDVGWVVGHSYIVYAPLLVGATTVLFEGKPIGTPDAGTFWRTIARHGVKSFTAPTAIRAIRKEDPSAPFLRDRHRPVAGDLPGGRAGRSRHDPLAGSKAACP